MSKSNVTSSHGVRYVEVTADAGQRIDNFLIRELSGVPRTRVYRMLRRGEVRINGQRAKPDYRLNAGDKVRIPPVRTEERAAAPASRGFLEHLRSCILFEDASLIVLNKPSGLAVHGGSGVSRGVIEGLRELFPDGKRLELAHRIDRDTSGLLLVARGRGMLLALHAAFREGRVVKSYDALVHGRWPKRLRTVQSPLTRYVTAGGERRVRVDIEDGKEARTDFEIVAATAAASWVRARPHTGRTHQIRVHCRQAQHPIVGDEKYSSDEQLRAARAWGIRRLCLHAAALVVTLQDRTLTFEAPTPADFTAAWNRLASAGAEGAHALVREERDEADQR